VESVGSEGDPGTFPFPVAFFLDKPSAFLTKMLLKGVRLSEEGSFLNETEKAFFLGSLSPPLSEQLQTNPPGEKGKIR